MPTRFFLNALRSKQGGLPAPDKGIWHRDADFLTRYANDVSLEGELDAESVPHSVPSVFQRPFQFLHALRNGANPHHKAVQSEWRGMMALIALKNWLGLDVTVTPFAVPVVESTASSYVGNEDIGNLHFRAMLRNQLPYRKVEEEDGVPRAKEERVSDWEKWGIVRCGGKLIGATSPWTMVYTASKYTAPRSIAWQREGLLIDPILHFSSLKSGPSKPVELSILYALVTDVLATRTSWAFPSALSTFSNLYSTLLEAWQADLFAYRDADLEIGITSSLFENAPYSESLRTVGELHRDDGDLYMDTKQGRVIVFSGSTGVHQRVYRGLFAGQVDIATLPAWGSSFKTKDGGVVPKPFVVVEKAFFPTKLVHVDLSSEAFISRNSSKASTPLTPTFFDYFYHKDLAWLSAVEAAGGVNATLRLPLPAGGESVGEMKYPAKSIETLSMKTPGLALWPDLYDEEWKGGFAAYAGPEQDSDDLSVGPLFQSGRKTDVEERAEIGKKQQGVRIWQCEEEPAIGFSLEWRLTGDQGRRVSAGLILLKTLKPMKDLSETRTARIGVDFGTSSTTVMMADRNGIPEELKFGGHLVSLTTEEYGRTREIVRNLYPDGDVLPPFCTLLYEATAKQFGKYTTPYTVRFVLDVANDLLNAPVSDLKWGARTGRDHSNPLTAYLNGLVRYIVWECLVRGMKHIELSWSYPTSLPEGQLTTMRNFWGSVTPGNYRRTTTVDGMPGGPKALTIKVMPQMSESEAACRAFTAGKARARTGSLTIAVDIGGGSTDIAYWSDRTLLDQTSFKLAGNDILDKAFLTDKTMLTLFEAVAKAKPSGLQMATIRARPEIYLNDLLSEAEKGGDPLVHPVRSYIFNGRDSVAPWQNFRSMIYLYFTGLCYYMGAQARSLGVEKPEIEIYFGGRGASMTSWFAATKSDIRKVLEYAFRLGLNRPKDDNIVNTFPGIPDVVIDFQGRAIAANDDLPKLKTEVARGLLLEPDLELDAAKVEKGVAVGETGWTKRGSGNISWTSRILPEELRSLKAPAASGFESNMIGHFRYVVLEEDKEGFLKTFNLDAEHLKSLKIEGSAIEDLIQRSSEGENKMAQPIFAYELKSLMSQYANMVSADGPESA